MQRLTLIRHGITDWNSAGRYQGHSDVPLSVAGRAQADRLAQRVPVLGRVDVITSSPSSRAVETATRAFPGREVIHDERLRELDFGVFEGHTHAANVTHPAWSWWTSDPYERPAPRGESYRELQRRAVDWFEEARGRYHHHHVVAVCHSGTIQMLLAHLLGIARPRWSGRLEVRHTSLSSVRFEAELTIVDRVNDAAHLEAPCHSGARHE